MTSPPLPKRLRKGSNALSYLPCAKSPKDGHCPVSAVSTFPQFSTPPLAATGSASSTGGRSTTSTSAKHLSASTIAKDSKAFRQVKEPNHFALMDLSCEEETLIIIYNGVKLPSKAIKDDAEFLAWSSGRYSINPAFDDGVWSSDDPYDLGHLKNELEFDLRAGIDTLMRQAFDGKYRKGRNPSRAEYQAEQELCLPAVTPGKVKADAVIWLPIPINLNISLTWIGHNDAHHVFSVKEKGDHNLLAAFVFEAKLRGNEDVGKRKICFDLCSAQHQRRAVGFNDHHIYGALLVGSTYTLYSSRWMKEGILIYPTTTVFDLSHFPEFLKLFVFLCRLADSIANEVDEMDREFNDDRDKFERRLKNATQNPWRPCRYLSGSVSEAESRRGGSAEDELSGPLSEGMSEDSDDEGNGISHDVQELPRLPLKKCHVKGIQKSAMDIHSWANQSTAESSVRP